jgi:hypothetical protein
MKLRVRGNSIRLRLTQREVADLVATGRVEETTSFASGARFGYAITCEKAVTSLAASFRGGVVHVSVPVHEARDWAASDRVGIEAEQPVDGGTLRLLVEKDFACLQQRAGDDDRDTFPNPDA